MTDTGTWVWIKQGDHREEVSQLCALFVAEMGQHAASGDVHGRVATTPSGTTYTFLVADSQWWHERMRVHPNDWTGHPLADVLSRAGL